METAAAAAKSLQSCPTLCDPIDGSPLGSSVHGIFQARVLEWVAIAFSSLETIYSEMNAHINFITTPNSLKIIYRQTLNAKLLKIKEENRHEIGFVDQ